MNLTSVPINWNKTLHQSLTYEITGIKDPEQNQLWKSAGHNLDLITVYVHQFHGTYDWMSYLLNDFDFLDSIKFSFNKIPPGHYFPTHRDLFGHYRTLVNKEINEIHRYIVFLEDWQDGHLLTIGDKVFSNWKAGAVVGWTGDTPHSAINLGTTDRYTLQVTGIKV